MVADVNPSTVPAESNGPLPEVPVREMIGRYVMGDTQVSLYRSRAAVKTVDETIPDYQFYDQLRRGAAHGYTLSGLFCKRIERVFADWVIGNGFSVSLKDEELDETRRDYTNGELSDFVTGLLEPSEFEDEKEPDFDVSSESFLQSVFRDALGLGDQYVFVNNDGTLSVPSPETVRVRRDPLDYRRVLAVTVETKLAEATITDEYTRERRTITTKDNRGVTGVEVYPVLIGRIPWIHIAYGRSANETNGHSIHETLLPLLDQYDDIAYKQLDGAKLLGNPIPYIAGLEDLNAVRDANKPTTFDTYYDKDGNQVERPQFKLDQNSIMLLGKGGSAGMLAPPVGFTKDTGQALQTLFWLILDHTGIPEFIWGNQISSGRSSSEVQLDTFIRDILGWQRDTGGWILRLCRIWLAVRALTDPKIVVGKLKIEWPDIVEANREVLLKFIESAEDRGLLRKETTLRLMELVDDPAKEIELAEEEAAERAAIFFPDGSTPDFQARLNQDNGAEDETPPGSSQGSQNGQPQTNGVPKEQVSI